MFSSFSKDKPKTNIIISNRQWIKNHKDEIPKLDMILVDECIRKGQGVKTNKGIINIENIKIGDNIYTYNIKSKKNEYKKVLKTYTNLQKSNSYDYFLQIELWNGKILEVTPNHKIYTTNRGYVRADQLNENDDILVR